MDAADAEHCSDSKLDCQLAHTDGVAATASAAPAPATAKDAMEECSVCFEAMDGSDSYRKLSCGHSYHHACIQRWLQRTASCPLCKADTPVLERGETCARKPFEIDLGHQEMCRMVQDIEDIFLAVHGCAGPDYPVALSGLVYNLCVSLGYEDEDELEEALGGTLADFLSALPHFEVVWPEVAPRPTADSSPHEAADLAATEQRPPEPRAIMYANRGDDDDPDPKKITFTVSERRDLWRVVLQGPDATISIPEIEFAICPDSKRRIDTIYNMISAAVYNLGDHVRLNSRAGAMSDDEASKIVAAIDSLNCLLDLDEPFTFVMSDPQGISNLKPLEGAVISAYIAED